MDLSSRLRAIVRGNPSAPRRELTYEPDGGYETVLDVTRVGEILGGRPIRTAFGDCLVIDRRYEADRCHGGIRIEECEVTGTEALAALDPSLFELQSPARLRARHIQAGYSGVPRRGLSPEILAMSEGGQAPDASSFATPRMIFLDLETTGLSGGAGTIAFLVGCGYFDVGAFQVRQFLLTSHAAERALLAAVADFFDGADLIVTYNGKTFDVPVMETRWLFHRMEMPLDGVPHFDMLHPARRLWRWRAEPDNSVGEGGCRLTTLERILFDVDRVGDVPGFEIPRRFFQFLRTADPRPLEPVLEHNRLDLLSLAAVTAHAARLARKGHEACRDGAEALALGRIYERAGLFAQAEACFRRASTSASGEVRGEALYRLGLRCRRERRFEEAAAIWREVLDLTGARAANLPFVELRQFAAEALAIHMEHRARDLDGAREHAVFALEDSDARRADGVRHRLARIDRKIKKKKDAQLFSN